MDTLILNHNVHQHENAFVITANAFCQLRHQR